MFTPNRLFVDKFCTKPNLWHKVRRLYRPKWRNDISKTRPYEIRVSKTSGPISISSMNLLREICHYDHHVLIFVLSFCVKYCVDDCKMTHFVQHTETGYSYPTFSYQKDDSTSSTPLIKVLSHECDPLYEPFLVVFFSEPLVWLTRKIFFNNFI